MTDAMAAPLASDALAGAYATMTLIRAFEEAILRLHRRGRLPGFMHVSVGQEAVPVGVCLGLRPDDQTTSPHRNHGHVIAKGASVEAMMAEMYGRAGGLCRGKGGSLHMADVSRGAMGANGIVAAGMPIAAGLALGSVRSGLERVVVAFVGDGAIANGTSHETLNLASLWRLPLVIVREDNQYAESTPVAEYQAIDDVVAYARSYGLAAEAVDGNDVEAVAAAAQRAVARARAGDGPTFLQCLTYRWYGHNIGDPGAYRPEGEVEDWKRRDPLQLVRRRMLQRGIATAAEMDEIDAAAAARVERAAKTAEAMPEPAAAAALEDVFATPAIAEQVLGSGS